MTGRRLALTAVAATLIVAATSTAVVLLRVAPIATGYAARIGCGVVSIQGRPVDAITAELPASPLTPLVRIAVVDGSVEASLLGRVRTRAAPDGDGGCRLLAPDEPAPAAEVPPMTPVADDLVVPTVPSIEAANAGLDTVALTGAVTGAFAVPADLGPDERIRTRAVVVVHQGTVVAERYADGFDPDTPLIGWSMTKSVAEAMVGRLALEGRLRLDDPVPGVWDDTDPRAAITWDQLLTMTDGLAFDESYSLGSDVTRMLFTDVDAARLAADQPLVAEPGTRWSYSSGTTNILCHALTGVAGGDPALVPRRLVFEPLAMTSATIGTAAGTPVCSSFAYATARDWARFGLLYEQEGVWGGQRLLPAGWVERVSTAPVSSPTVDPDTGEVTPYGRHWWLNAGPGGRRMPTVPTDAFWAAGNEGQFVVVVPSRDLVIVRLGFDAGVTGLERRLEPLVAGAVAAVDRTGGG